MKRAVKKLRNPPLPWAELRGILKYDPLTGELTWAKNRQNVIAGTAAGHLTSAGRVKVGILGCHWWAEDIAWFLFTREWPENRPLFLDGNHTNLRFDNLHVQGFVPAYLRESA